MFVWCGLIDLYFKQAGRCWDCDPGGKGEFCTNQKKAQGFVGTPVDKLQVRLSLRKARGSSQSHSVTHGAGMFRSLCYFARMLSTSREYWPISVCQVLMKDVATPASQTEVRGVIKKALENAALVNYERLSEEARIEGKTQFWILTLIWIVWNDTIFVLDPLLFSWPWEQPR